jgi:hypothetical protein
MRACVCAANEIILNFFERGHGMTKGIGAEKKRLPHTCTRTFPAAGGWWGEFSMAPARKASAARYVVDDEKCIRWRARA